MEIIEISKKYFEEWLNIGLELWSKYLDKKEILRKEFEEIISSKNQTAFLYFDNQKKLIWFINVSIRYEYVQWAKSNPVWYIEWIFVKKEHRNTWIANKLVEESQIWMKLNNCKEIASDTAFDNNISQSFHKKLWFREAGKIIHYIKNIDSK